MKKRKLFRIARFVIFIIFLGINVFLIVESLTPSTNSAKQSNSVGNAIVDIVNDVNGDQAEIIEPTEVQILNKVERVDTLSKMTLEINTLPENTRYKSYTFTSSDDSIASVDEFGNVLYKKEGIVTISAINTYNEEIKDSFTVSVFDIKAEELTAEISGVTPDSTGIYTLYIGNLYNIKTKITPNNTTNKEIEYYVDSNDYIEVSIGSINVLKESNDEVIEVHVFMDDLEEIIKVKTEEEPIITIPVESFKVLDISGYQNSTITITSKVSFTPSNASNKDFEIVEILDTTIAKINSAKSIKLLKSGETKIRIKSKDTNTIEEGKITVNARPALTDYTLSLAGDTLLKGETKKITISNLKPKNAQIETQSFESLNTDILSVTSKGQVKGLALGMGVIRVTVNGITKDISIEVLNNEEDTTDFTIEYLKGENPYILVGEEIKLGDYFSVSEYIPHDPIYKTIIYNLESGNATINNDKLIPLKEGLIQVNIIHKSSGISKVVSLRAYSNVWVLEHSESTFTDNLIINQELHYGIKTDSAYEPIIEISNDNAAINYSDGELNILGRKEGVTTITIYPSYGNSKVVDGKITITVFVTHKYTSKMDLHFTITSKSKEEREVDNPDHINLIVSDSIKYTIGYDLGITKKKLIITSSNKDVISIVNQKLIIKGVGDTTLVFLEDYSNIEETITVHVKNFVALKEDENVVIKGDYEFDGTTISIINGDSVSIKYNFTSLSTIKTTKYTSSNPDVVKIGDDGVITPLSSGEATITMVVSDSEQTFIESSFKVVVKQKDFVDDITEFIYVYVRKGLGHFGIFFVLAIFACLSIFMYFRNDKWYIILIKTAIVFAYGLAFAGLTEYLQTLAPGRCGLWSDVLVDYTGYTLAGVILSIGFIGFLLIRYYKNKKKNKDEIEDSEVE